MFVERDKAIASVVRSFRVHPAVALIGPRQCGKTTLAEMIAADEEQRGEVAFFDLERAADRHRLETPQETLAPLAGLVVIDEIQRQPALYETLRVLIDRRDAAARFLLLGSASPALIRGTSETLAGRVGLVDLSGFNMAEVRHRPGAHWRTLWWRGGFPRSYLAAEDADSALWREDFVCMYLERDVAQLGITVHAEMLRRFWTMVAHYHGQVWNAAEFARAIGAGQNAARRYLDILAGAYMVRVLPPWYENIGKRQVRAPKVYVRDTGILHALLDLGSPGTLSGHPKVGASFEGFVVEQLLSCLDLRNPHFWATHGGAELDLMVVADGKRYGFEVKYSDAPGTTRSMHIALDNLALEHLWVVYPGAERYPLTDRITALPVAEIPDLDLRP